MPQTLHDHFAELALYDLWANRMVLGSIDPLPQINEELYLILGHLVLAKTIWIDRLTGVDTRGRSPWPAPHETPQRPDLASVANDLVRADARHLAFTRSTPDLQHTVTYATSTGAQMTDTVLDILTHLAHHSAHHRGQLAALVSQLGGTPAGTDFVLWVRNGRPNA